MPDLPRQLGLQVSTCEVKKRWPAVDFLDETELAVFITDRNTEPLEIQHPLEAVRRDISRALLIDEAFGVSGVIANEIFDGELGAVDLGNVGPAMIDAGGGTPAAARVRFFGW